MNEVLMNCPKCSFQQPQDRYCASCGVDMSLVAKKPQPGAAQPVKLAAMAALAIIVTVVGFRTYRQRHTTVTTFASESPQTLAAREAKRRENLSAKASPQQQQNIVDHTPAKPLADDSNAMLDQADSEVAMSETTPTVAAAEPVTPAVAAAAGAATAAVKPSSMPANARAATDLAAREKKGLAVTFAWAEVSPAWLQSMGAMEPGIHPLPDLEARLRESAGGYHIVEMNKQRLVDPQPIQMSRGDRFNLRFDVMSVSDASITGSLQTSLRGADGAVRAPAAASMSIDKGQGTIISFGAAGQAGPTGTAMVVLILPRWDAERNP